MQLHDYSFIVLKAGFHLHAARICRCVSGSGAGLRRHRHPMLEHQLASQPAGNRHSQDANDVTTVMPSLALI